MVGIATSYDLRYSITAITEANWTSAIRVSGEPAPRSAGLPEAFTISELSPGTDYYFALKVGNELPNWSALSNVPHGTTQPRTDSTHPVAQFMGTPLSGIAPLVVSFTDQSTNAPTSWSWSFGDGTTSAEGNPVHEFKVAGTFTVTLTPTNAGGSDIETKTGYITVTAPPPPGGDIMPPADINDLISPARGVNWVKLAWSAPGDDRDIGQATSYLLRYLPDNAIGSEAQWQQATPASGALPSPVPAGMPQDAVITGLLAGTTYGIGIRAADDQGNIGGLSNRLVVTTLDSIPPADTPPLPASVTHVAALSVGVRSAIIELRHPMPPESGLAVTEYVVAVARSPITVQDWAAADTTRPGPEPGLPGSATQWTVGGLLPSTEWFLALRTRDVSGRLAPLSPMISFRTLDETLSPPTAPEGPDVQWSGDGNFLVISWPPSADPRAIGYHVYGQDSTGDWRVLVDLVFTATRCELSRSAILGFVRVAVATVISDMAESTLSPAALVPSESWRVDGPFPHPVTERCTVRVHVPADFPPGAHLRVDILDLSGHRVALLRDGIATAGATLELSWNRISGANRAGPGYYYLRVEGAGHRVLRTIYLAP
jgi:PKD repeat protein